MIRKILKIEKSVRVRAGNPKNYLYLSECGHISVKSDSGSTDIDRLYLKIGKTVKKICLYCSSQIKDQIDFDFIERQFGKKCLHNIYNWRDKARWGIK